MHMLFKCYSSPCPPLLDWWSLSSVSTSLHMKQDHESMNKKPAQPACYIMAIFLIAVAVLLSPLPPFHLFFLFYTSEVVTLCCPLSFLSIFLLTLFVWQQNASESCHLPLPALIIPRSSATCLSLRRGVRGRAKSSIVAGESRGGLYVTDKFSFTPSPHSSLNFIFHLCCHSQGNGMHLLPLENMYSASWRETVYKE